MGVFREFFEGIWNTYVKEPIDALKGDLWLKIGEPLSSKLDVLSDVKTYLDSKVGAPIKDALDTIFDSLDTIKTAISEAKLQLAEDVKQLGLLKEKLELIADFFEEQKTGVVGFFQNVLNYVENRQISFWIGWMQRVRTVAALDNVYKTVPKGIKENEGVSAYYEMRREELHEEGMDTTANLAGGIVGSGVKWGVDAVTKAALENIQPVIDDFFEGYTGDLKDKKMVDDLASSGEFGLNAVVGFMLGHFLSPVISTSLAPAWEGMGQVAWQTLPVKLADPGTLIKLKYRGLITDDLFSEQLRKQGVGDEVQKLYEDSYLYYPSPAELVNWQAKEVFEPAMITKYGLDAEIGGLERDAFYKAGMSDEQITNFWRAHWEHPSWRQVVEMLHRGLMHPTSSKPSSWSDSTSVAAWEAEAEKEVYAWFKLVEIPPFWRQKLIDMSYNVPTRVDVRRWYDLRTITEERLRELYHAQGYHGKDLDDYVLWTKIYVLEGDLKDRYKKGWITEETVATELREAGMPEERVKEWVETIVKAQKAERTTKERELTKAEIVKGVKKTIITTEQGVQLLEDMGYDADEAKYILLINIEAQTGSPGSFWEFKRITEMEKKATGKKGKVVPETLIEAEKKHRKDPGRMDLELEYREEMKKWEEGE